MIERRRYCEHPPRFEYLLTDAGKELQPILLALKLLLLVKAGGLPVTVIAVVYC